MPRAVLIVEDDQDVLEAARFCLHGSAEILDACDNPEQLKLRLAKQSYDVVLLDMNFAPGSQDGVAGLAALDELRKLDSALSVILMTAFGGVSLAVEGLKRGAADFVLKPWHRQKLLDSLDRGIALTSERRAASQNFDLEALERRTIARALEHCEGSIPRAAQMLGLTRPTLYRRISQYAL